MKTPEAEFVATFTDSDGEKQKGKFKMKLRLSYRERLQMDEIRRSVLGFKSQEASQEAQMLANAIAKIQIHLTDSPSWWKNNGNGLDFEDPQVVFDVLDEVVKAEQEYFDSIKKKADEARADLAEEKK
jgi:hypothetical protein